VLARLETVYLNTLRVVILIAATIALIVAVVSLVGALPSLMRKAGLSGEAAVSGGTLREFIDEQKVVGTEASETTATEPTDSFVSPDIVAAAKNFNSYLKNEAPKEKDWQKYLTSKMADVPVETGSDYAVSINGLSEQVKASKGKALSFERVNQLVEWHFERFRADAELKELAQAQDSARFWVTMGAADAAFLTFVLIVFIFLFVKIERSLRVVRTERVAADDA
jgi:hypothetical protein